MSEHVPVRGRIVWMDTVRGLAIMLMLMLHATLVPAIYASVTPAGWLVAINDALAPARMPVLMFLSGILLHKSLQKPPGRFITGKLRALLWPYCIWAVVFLAAAGRLAEVSTPWTWVQTIYLWYLGFILIYYLLMLVFVRLPWWLPMGSALFAYVYFHAGDRGFIQKFFFYWLFFQLGHMFTVHGWKKALAHPLTKISASLGLVFAATVHASGLAVPENLPIVVALWNVARAALVVAAVVVWAPVIFRAGRFPLLTAVGRDSLVFYVSHFPVMIWGSQALAAITDLPAELMTLGCLILALLVGQLFVSLKRRFALADAVFKAPLLNKPAQLS